MAHEGLWKQLGKLGSQETARRAKCDYEKDLGRYINTFLNKKYVVEPSLRRIFAAGLESQRQDANFLEQLCILAYLINAKDIPLAGKLVGATALAGGEFFFRGLHCLPTDKLARAFGRSPERLYQAAAQFNAKQTEFGDAAIQLPVLPRLPIVFVIWGGDDEFGPRASILFDQTATAQLPLDALLTAVNLAVDAVIQASEQSG